jgi:hypothetical protein
MKPRSIALALVALLAAGAAHAQTYDPAQAQQRLNQQQLDIQSQQLQQMQRQNTQALQQPDASARLRAGATQQQIQQQTEATTALRQQMLSPNATPAAINAQIQANGARIQQSQVPPP